MVLKVGGFPEYTPAQQLVFDELQAIVQSTYQQYGYVHIETPAVERNEVLLKGGEQASNQIFGLYGLAQGAEDTRDYSLHFDLTVPFTRYVVDNTNDLVFPFKRMQVQPVWRGERAQKGRFNQFYQADIDVIWRNNEKLDYLYYDAEVLFIINATLDAIKQKFLKDADWVMHVNNRKVITGFFEYITEGNKDLISGLYKLFDDFYKIGESKFEIGLQELGLTPEQIDKILQFTTLKVGDLSEDFCDHPLFVEGLRELQKVFYYLEKLDHDTRLHFHYDPFIVRGLDYYTGTVFEVLDHNNIGHGSISGGGRYDNLTQSIAPKSHRFDGVGGSIGLSRICSMILDQMEDKHSLRATNVDYLFVNFEDTFNEVIDLAVEYSADGKAIEIYPEPVKLQKQFTYADRKGIPYVVILGSGEREKGTYTIKDMKTGETKSEKLTTKN